MLYQKSNKSQHTDKSRVQNSFFLRNWKLEYFVNIRVFQSNSMFKDEALEASSNGNKTSKATSCNSGSSSYVIRGETSQSYLFKKGLIYYWDCGILQKKPLKICSTRGGWKWGREAGKAEVGERGGGKRQKTVLEQQ